MLIGIAGTLGAGKGTVVDYLVKKKGFKHYSSSGRLKEILDEKGVPATRKNLSALADELAGLHKGGILHLSNQKLISDGAKNAILEAIHRQSEADFVRSIGGVVLGVDANPKIRYERTIKRKEGEKDNVSYEEFMESIAREEEGKGDGTPHIRAVIDGADFVLNNDGTLEELHAQIEVFLKNLST